MVFADLGKGRRRRQVVDGRARLGRTAAGEILQAADETFDALRIAAKHVGECRDAGDRRVQRLGILVEDAVDVTQSFLRRL